MSVLLKEMNYREREGEPLQWSLRGLTLGQVNLLVGKNATGKSRTINLIVNLASQLLKDKLDKDESWYEATFHYDGIVLQYVLLVHEGKVVQEKLWYDGELRLNRDESKLSLWYEKEQTHIDHEPSEREVSAVSRLDKLQHPFLLPLRIWADAVRAFHFGSTLGKDSLAIVVNSEDSVKEKEVDRNETHVVAIFRKAVKEYGEKYTESILSDMNYLAYPLTEITADTPSNITLVHQSGNQALRPPGELTAIGVREKGVGGIYHQNTISQGMFRALSLLIQVTYSQMSGRANCIVIDDIGEGLDFDRSSLLIDLLRSKAKQSKFQLIMATNDQFVMNHVPLEEWSVLQRNGSEITVKNIHNSKELFERFRFVGLNNFSFLEMGFADEDSDANQQLRLEVTPDNE